MRITNLSKKKLICESAQICDTVFSKARGLMFRRPRPLLFRFPKARRVSLHMWFVFWPIDVIFLNEQMRVVDIKEGFKPFRFYTSRLKAASVIEVPHGTIRRSGTEVGDLLVRH